MPTIGELGFTNNQRVYPELTEEISLASMNQEIPNKSIDLSKFNGTLTVDALNIPDATTDDSLHIETDGDTYWGCTPTDWASDNDNAPAYVKSDGTAKFGTLTVGSTGMTFQDKFGDGTDGDVTLSADITLSKDMFYDDLDLGVYNINTNGYRIFVAGSLDGTGYIRNNGNDGGDATDGTSASSGVYGYGGTGGTGGTAAAGNSLPSGEVGLTGVDGRRGQYNGIGVIGTSGTAGGTTNKAISESSGVAGASGGDDGSGDYAGGVAGTAGISGTAIINKIHTSMSAYLLCDLIGGTVENFNITPKSGGGGTGAIGYANSATTSSGGSGGSGGNGSSGGIVWVAARRIIGAVKFQAMGGNGGNGGSAGDSYAQSSTVAWGTGGSAAGSGGGGGAIILITAETTTPYSLSVLGGTGGTGGTGGKDSRNAVLLSSGGEDGSDGNTGASGITRILKV